MKILEDEVTLSGFRKSVQLLLEDSYDPMFDYQMDKRKGDVLFRVVWET